MLLEDFVVRARDVDQEAQVHLHRVLGHERVREMSLKRGEMKTNIGLITTLVGVQDALSSAFLRFTRAQIG